MRYTKSIMVKEVSFQLDTAGASAIITDMMRPVIDKSTKAIASRANSVAGSISSDPPTFDTDVNVGTIKKGRRVIGTVRANINNKRDSFVAHNALAKSKDAGRL